MSALPGRDLASSPRASAPAPGGTAGRCAAGLHAIPVAACPFDQRLASRLQAAQARVEAGLVDADDFDDERLGQSAQQVFAELRATRPNHEDLVVSHGDACLPNLLAAEARFSGFIDCGRLGVPIATRIWRSPRAAWSTTSATRAGSRRCSGAMALCPTNGGWRSTVFSTSSSETAQGSVGQG